MRICAMLEDEEDGGYSGRGYAYRRGERRDGYGGRGGYMAREHRDGGYSRTDIREHLNDMMNDAPDENTRMEIRRVIERMDQR